MRIVRCKNSLTAVLADGRIIQTNNCTDELYEQAKKFYAHKIVQKILETIKKETV